ncbi:hypothetical protein TNCV_2139641 [Trichonephila clavipes]|uniref:Uncharacterized protein n=1 Tax=Trichonephila clavipes TaxID=2585209 RepID=A0A8X6S079_TRICX|nr:hypothetical protein TNCV_2139641 [Trichonephila clavipes]
MEKVGDLSNFDKGQIAVARLGTSILCVAHSSPRPKFSNVDIINSYKWGGPDDVSQLTVKRKLLRVDCCMDLSVLSSDDGPRQI